MKKANSKCLKCSGTGKVYNELIDLELDCDCVIDTEEDLIDIEEDRDRTDGMQGAEGRQGAEIGDTESTENAEETEDETKLVINGNEYKIPKNNSTEADIKMLRYFEVIPEDRRNDDYSYEFVKAHLSNEYKSRRVSFMEFDNYMKYTLDILGRCIAGEKLSRSYFISSCNGSGKTTLAMSCLKALQHNGIKCVPYLSLGQIAAIRDAWDVATIDRIENKLRQVYNRVAVDDASLSLEKIVGQRYDVYNKQYTWEDLCTVDTLFMRYDSLISTDYEVDTLITLLKERSLYSRPTVVLSDYSIKMICNVYADKVFGAIGNALRSTLFNDYISYSGNNLVNTYDKLLSVTLVKKQENNV